MRVVWWAILLVFGLASTAQAQTAPAASAETGALIVSPKLRLHTQLGEDEMTSILVADKMETDEDGKVILTGNAEVRRIDSVVKGDHIDYQRETGQVNVRGNGLIMREGNIVRGPELSYNVDAETGEVNDPNFWLGADGGSGTAEKADIFSRSQMRLNSARYAGCPCENPPWYITSPRVDFDFDENEGVARNAVLYFKGVPILASPYLSFPLRKERKSGFLLPTYGGSSNSGLEFTLPYYFNLAPNYDLTLTPRYMAKRGLQLGAEFRYLGRGYNGQLTGTYLNRDKLTEDQRWMYWWQHRHSLGGGFSAYFDVRRVSDDDYFRDFTTFGLNEATIDALPSIARLNWSGSPYWQAYLQTYTYQTLQDRTSTYRRPQFDKLPEFYVRGARYNWGGFDVATDNYATKFSMPKFRSRVVDMFPSQNLDSRPTFPYQAYDGTRLSSYNAISYPIVRPGWYVTPKAALHLSQYTTHWNGFTLARDPITGIVPGTPRTQSRAVPLLSLDSGMTFERETTLFGNDSIQTLEPRVYYLYVPYRDQSTLPVFDTSLATFNFSQAFDENLFSGGWDRIANANQVTVGLTTRWLDEDTGFERLSLSAAQRIYFEDQKVTLPGARPRTNTKSDYLVGATAALTDKLDVRFDAQFNPENRDRNRMSAGFRWQPQRLAMLATSYRYERDPSQISNPSIVDESWYVDRSREQVSVYGQWPLHNKLYALGRVDYSLQEKRSTQSIFGLEYKGDCCWAARVVYQRYAVSEQDANTAVFFQLELSGLGSLGTDPMGMLSRTINGYQTVTPPIPEKTTFERYE
ncbi:LPS-assembly protein LptD [Pusillimonas caeni]|uniref:LPS-assembly protein LptD n=1 Tax=Pusillimonas caeni TaxID=1348472 RepID=UPI001ADD6B9C|nr:LPS-assembly protein LptD [Pusillimonas caeni]